MEGAIKGKNPHKIDIGAVYNVDVSVLHQEPDCTGVYCTGRVHVETCQTLPSGHLEMVVYTFQEFQTCMKEAAVDRIHSP